jgi:glycosyltransferase involved in cell wall biosynthesis
MNIYINGRFLAQKITGVQRFALEFLKALDKVESKFNFVLLIPKNVKINFDFSRIKVKQVGSFTGHIWEQIDLPICSRNGILLNLCNTGCIFKRKQIVVIHDTAVYDAPLGFSWKFRTLYKFIFSIISRNSIKIITVSQFSKKRIIHNLKMRNEKVAVVTEGIDHFISVKENQEFLKKINLSMGNYALFVSSLNPNKNFKILKDVSQLLKYNNFKIVIAGGTNPKVFNIKSTENNDLFYVGYVTDSELKSLYKNAGCFVFPSLYEGFGLPPVEAMSVGCPVIVSNTASLPEVCGDAALYIDPYSPEDIAEKIKLLLSDDNLREELRRKGLERAKLFSWEKCAKEMIKVIEEVLAK